MDNNQTSLLCEAVRSRLQELDSSGRTVAYENIIENIAGSIVKPGDVVVDGGAHMGHHLFPLIHHVGATGSIYAFEPIPYLHESLQSRLQEYLRLHPCTVHLSQHALSDKVDTVAFNWVKNAPAASGFLERNYSNLAPDIQRLEVDTTTLDLALEVSDQRRTSFIKLDLEGAEFSALKGARAILTTGRPVVSFEFGGPETAKLYGYARDAFFDYWASVRYRLFDLFGDPYDVDHWSDYRPYCFWAAPAEGHFENTLREALPPLSAALISLLSRYTE